MAKIGRPTKRTPAVEALILDGLSCGLTLKKICVGATMPDPQTVLRWTREDAEFRSAYTRAREEGADCMVERIIDLADDAIAADPASVPGIRQATENLKWAAGKFRPKMYGDKISQEITGASGGAIQFIIEQMPDTGQVPDDR